jgi:hypothetical protein
MVKTITINRAPVLTLWAAVVVERLGFDWQEALTLGRAVAGLSAHSKGARLATRYVKQPSNFLAILKLAAVRLQLKPIDADKDH